MQSNWRVRRSIHGSVAATVLAVSAGISTPAFAYCRATACDPSKMDCGQSAQGCQTEGNVLRWKNGDVELAVDEAGSMFRGISGEDTQRAVEDALTIWMSADCPKGGHPSFTGGTTLAAGLHAGFVDAGTNESVVVYVDGPWPYETGAVAKTELGFSLDTGDILDADIVFNASDFALSLDPTNPDDVDLTAVLAHEMGHVLGLAHSDVPGATMQPETKGFATAALKSLEPDDMAGICAIYPPKVATKPSATGSGASSATTDGSPANGCTVARGFRSTSTLASFAATSALVLLRRRRRGRFHPRQRQGRGAR